MDPRAIIAVLVYSWCHTFFDALYWTIVMTGTFDIVSTKGASRFSTWASSGRRLEHGNDVDSERVSCTISNTLDHASRDRGTWARFTLDTSVFVTAAAVLLAVAPQDADSIDYAQRVLYLVLGILLVVLSHLTWDRSRWGHTIFSNLFAMCILALGSLDYVATDNVGLFAVSVAIFSGALLIGTVEEMSDEIFPDMSDATFAKIKNVFCLFEYMTCALPAIYLLRTGQRIGG